MNTFKFNTIGISYTKAEQKIINYIYENTYSILFLSISQFANLLDLSEATISRFAKHAGFSDFKTLKNQIAIKINQESPSSKMSETITKENSTEFANLMQYQQYCISKTLEHLDENQLHLILDAMDCSNHIYLYGKGAAKSLCTLLQFRLNRFGKLVTLLPSGGTELYEQLIHIKEQDLVLLFSFQKLSREAQIILKHGKEIPYKTALFTSQLYDSHEKRALYNLFVYRGESLEYHSLAVPTAVVDALVILYASKHKEASIEQLEALHRLKQKYHEDFL